MPNGEYIHIMLCAILTCEAIIFLPIFYLIFIWPWVEMIKKRGSKQPEVGDDQIIEKFLWLPTIIDRECRWLIKAKIKQHYKAVAWEDIMGLPMAWGWVNISWV